jgi:hypothetical protein
MRRIIRSDPDYDRDQELIKSSFEYLWGMDEEKCRVFLIELYGGRVDDESLYVDYEEEDSNQTIYLKKDYNISIFYIGFNIWHSTAYYTFSAVDEIFEMNDTAQEFAMRIRKLKLKTFNEEDE